MSAFKGTPGPWVVHSLPNAPFNLGHHVTTADGLTVCSVTFQFVKAVDGKVVEVERIANARLIAAAPALLSVALAVDDIADRIDHDPDSALGELVTLARAAIAKATGERP